MQDTTQLYDGAPLDDWIELLGPHDLHYHFALAGVNDPFANSISEILPHLTGHVLDLGCGFGGPARMIQAAGHDVTCVSHSQVQLDYIQSRQATNTLLADLNAPPAWPDANTALMVESFCHIRQQSTLLASLTTERLVMIAHQSKTESFFHPLWQMQFHNEQDFRALLDQAGWHIIHWQDRMPEKAAMTAQLWRKRLNQIPKPWNRHWELLDELSTQIETVPSFTDYFALIDLVAIRKETL